MLSSSGFSPDFNGDGFDDLAIGIPYEDVGSVTNAGAVAVLYGTGTGLSSANDQFWTQNSSGVADFAETEDYFGAALAAGDFNRDGWDDLAIGAPREDVGTIADAGVVHVLFGSARRLTAKGDQFWTQDDTGLAEAMEDGDAFGDALTAGDFDNDGFVDLAIGIIDEDVGSVLRAGGVNVLYGSAAGLTDVGAQFWSQDSSGVEGAAEEADGFGRGLAAGDFNNDGRDDVAIGVPHEDIGELQLAGCVNVLYGLNGDGLNAANDQLWSQDSAGIEGAAESIDVFGAALSSSGHYT